MSSSSRSPVTVWILLDQLVPGHPALVEAEQRAGRDRLRVVLVESRADLTRLPYHRKRQVLLLSAGRHYAESLRADGYAVDVVAAEETAAGLARHLRKHRSGQIVTMAAADFGIRQWQLGRISEELGVPVQVLPNKMFLVERFNPLPDPDPDRRYVMEGFYRSLRKHFRVLLDSDGEPTGGAWNFDKENRKRLPAGIRSPEPLRFPPDEMTRVVMAEVDRSGHGVGSTSGFDLAVTHEDAARAFDDFLTHRLPDFGPFEDAMARDEGVLFHSVLSPQMNLGLLEPLAMVRAAEQAYRDGHAPINSVEGFIRQILGWREFIYWQYHRQMPGLRTANRWNARRPLPRLFWDGQTDMACLHAVVSRLLKSGYTHHIERLMILCNFCLLAGIDPAEVADWFLSFYVDAHDWVVLPNVIGMGLNADDGRTATKPYIASAAYIHRMSDFCQGCRYRFKDRTGPDACPFNTLYWNFLIEHEPALRANPRLGPAVLGLKRIDAQDRAVIQHEAAVFLNALEPYASRQSGD